MIKAQLLTAIALFCVPISLLSAPLPAGALGGLDFNYRGDYFFSDQNLSDESGDIDGLPADGNYTNFSNLFELGYSFRPGFRLSAGGIFAYATSETSSYSKSNSEFNTAILSAQYFFGTKKFRWVPNIRLNFAIEEIERNQGDEVFTSEGSSRYEFGSWFRYPLGSLDTYAYAAYIYQEDDKADLLGWALGVKWPISQFILQGEISGVKTLVDDAETSTPNYRESSNRIVAAGSHRYNSVNPEYYYAELLLNYQISSTMRLGGGLGHTITGKNYGYGPSILLTYSAEFGLGDSQLDSTDRLDGQKDSFEPQVESYDEELFR